MPSWTETLAQLRWSYTLSTDGDEAVELGWEFEGPDGPVQQIERVEHVEALGRPHVCIVAPARPASEIDPAAALRHNDTLGVGALVIRGDMMLVRAMLDLETLSWAVLDEAMKMVAHEAARLRRSGLS